LIKEKNKELCDEIYYKLPVMLIDEHEHNSYLEEEIKILKDMKKIYSDDAEKRERIEHVINKLFTKEADLQSKFWGSTYRAKKELNEKFSK
jgi:phage repressor protein C with HTH and peptisase S24 domain